MDQRASVFLCITFSPCSARHVDGGEGIHHDVACGMVNNVKSKSIGIVILWIGSV